MESKMKTNNKAGFTSDTKKSMGTNSNMSKPDMQKGHSDAEHRDEPEIIGMIGVIRRKGLGR